MDFHVALVAFTTFFATVGPADLAFVFAALTRNSTAKQRRDQALRGVLVAGGILMFFALFGQSILSLFGITLPALRTGGGILLLLIAIDMVFARHSGGVSTTSEENAEAQQRDDISVFPLAMPLIAGPGSISATILSMSNAHGDQAIGAQVIAALVLILALTYVALLSAIPIQRLLGVTGLSVVSRIVGILLAALSVQFIFDGIRASGIMG